MRTFVGLIFGLVGVLIGLLCGYLAAHILAALAAALTGGRLLMPNWLGVVILLTSALGLGMQGWDWGTGLVGVASRRRPRG